MVCFTPLLSAKVKLNSGAPDPDMVIAKRREAERAILLPVLLVAYSNERCLQKAYQSCEHLIPSEFLFFQIPSYFAADFRKSLTKVGHAVVLRFVAGITPLSVIPVLFSPSCIPADGLQMALRIRTDPDIRPCRWDRQAQDTALDVGILYDVAPRIKVAEESFPEPIRRNPGERY